MIPSKLINHIKNYPYPDYITLEHALESEQSENNHLCFLAGFICQGNSFSLYLYLHDGHPIFHFFLDNDESDKEDHFITLSGTIENYEFALGWMKTISFSL